MRCKGTLSFVIIVVCLGCATQCTVGQKEGPGKHSTKAEESDQKKGDTYNISVGEKTDGAANGKTQEVQKADNAEDRQIQMWLVILTGGLVFVGGLQAIIFAFTFVAVVVQAIRMGEHAEHLQKLADSADRNTKNTEALINVDRAWLLPIVDSVTPTALPTIRITGIYSEEIAVRFKNFGRTPAWVTDWDFEAIVSEKPYIEEDGINHEPDEDFPHARPFPPGETHEFQVPWNVNGWDEIAAIQAGQKYLFIRGYITYRSLVGTKECYSGFCFQHFQRRNTRGDLVEGWWMAPADENRYT
jgi:hypothetical protein